MIVLEVVALANQMRFPLKLLIKHTVLVLSERDVEGAIKFSLWKLADYNFKLFAIYFPQKYTNCFKIILCDFMDFFSFSQFKSIYDENDRPLIYLRETTCTISGCPKTFFPVCKLFIFSLRQYHRVWKGNAEPWRDTFVCIMWFTALDGWFVLNIGGVKSKERLQQGGRSRLVRLGKQSTRRGASGWTVCYHEWKSAKRRILFFFLLHRPGSLRPGKTLWPQTEGNSNSATVFVGEGGFRGSKWTLWHLVECKKQKKKYSAEPVFV